MRLFLILFFCFQCFSAFTQSARERSVEVSATVQENPPKINFSWPEDASATFYNVYKKELDAQVWGERIAVLPGTATSFMDTAILVGEAYEYAFFKKEFDLVRDTVCLLAGSEVKFTIQDMYGIGLCCSFNFGYYRIEACGEVLAEGSDFDWSAEEYFTVCNEGSACTQVIITIAPDIFPNSTSWVLTDTNTNVELANSGPVGSFIDERPKYGFITAGIKAPAIENRGKILLLIDDAYTTPLSMEIARLKTDLIAEGWEVITRTANKNDAVTSVKAEIMVVYQQHPDLIALFIIGHVPVPYSGDIYPDTHSENHQGAWSADTYYAELDGNWTDDSVDITTAFFDRNKNVPGDGKFDQDSIPTGTLELQIGRLDLYDMTAFALDEIELTRNYLNKDHGWRSGAIEVQRRGLIDDNFGNSFAAPAASGWRNFAPMFGADQIDEVDYFSTLRNESYLWSYGCGSGTHISADGIGNTSDFSNDSLLTIFTMLFGSQFGDWDNENNFLKAPLASGLTLTNVWAGNPPWTFHQMALGQHIGFCSQATQNTNGLYLPGPQVVHTALMGDPTLKLHIVKAPLSFTAFQSLPEEVSFSFTPSPDPEVIGYYLYRSTNPEGGFERVHAEILTDPAAVIDSPPFNGVYHYMLRAVKLETSGSGTYYNLSPGLIDSTDFYVGLEEAIPNTKVSVQPNPSSGLVVLTFEKQLSKNWELEVLDVKGTLIFAEHFAPCNQQTLDLSNYSNGIYILKIRSESGLTIKKLVVTKIKKQRM